MKNLKKLVRQATLLLVIFAGLSLIFSSRSPKAFALLDPGGGTPAYTAAWVDRSTITVTAADGTSATLNDAKWDRNWDYTGSWTTSDGTCPIEINGFGGSQIVGLTQRNGSAGWNANASYARLRIQAKQGVDCVQVYDSNNSGYPSSTFPIGNPNDAENMFAWQDSGTIVRVDGNDGFTFSSPVTKSDGSFWFTRASEASAGSCQDTLVVSAGRTSATLYELSTSSSDGSGGNRQKAPPSISDKCYMVNTVDSLIGLEGTDAANSNVPSDHSLPLGGTIPTSVTPTGGGAGGTATCSSVGTCINSGDDSSACVANSHTSLEWILCPIITSVSKFADGVNDYIEGQLNFNINSYLPDNGQVNKAWTIIKDVVSGLVVVLLLVMVISQAAGSQLLDAYTIKKMLPRLVIAVIAMQFSWVLGKWLIGLANDMGVGIKDLMLLPFGGGGNMDLPSIMHHLNPIYPLATQGAIIGVLFLLLFTPLSTFILPIFLFIALGVGSALLTGLATIVFRNALIILGVLFAPFALLLWATPGQTMQGYWKKYSDNFTKALLLFPLIMAMIYAGRIVAWTVGGLGTPGLIDYLIVLIAYFAPYFLVPKAFRWGGSILAGANQAINSNGAYKWAHGFLSNRIKSEAARRSAQQGAKWNPDDDYLRLGRFGTQFNPKSRLGRAVFTKKDAEGNRVGRKNLLTSSRLFSKTQDLVDEKGNVVGQARIGRRNIFALQGRKMQGLAGGAIFDKGLSNEGMLKRSEAHKHTADEASDTRKKRAIEAGRDRSNAALMFARDSKTGKLTAVTYEKGKGPYSITAGMANAMAGINSPEWRDDGEFAKLLLHPEAGIYAKNRIPMDTSNRLWKKRRELERKYGLSGEYDPAHNILDRRLGREFEDLKTRQGRFDELSAKQARGETLTAEEDKELNRSRLSNAEMGRMNELDVMFTLRKARVRKLSQAELDKTKGHLETLSSTNPEAIEKADGVMTLLNVDENGNPVPEGQEIKFVPFTKHPAVTKKATSVPELTQAIAGIAPADLPIVMEKWAQTGYSFDNEPDSPIGVGNYNWKDMYSYFISDHDNMQRENGQNESEEKELSIRFKKGKQQYDIGKIGQNQFGDPALLGGDERLRLYLRNLERQDPNTAAVLANKMATESTKIPFDEGFSEGTLNPGDLVGEGHPDAINVLEYIRSRPPQERAYWKKYAQEMFRMRRQMGIDDNDARKITSRDLLIAQETPRYRYYDPTWTAKDTRDVFDAHIDPNGSTEPVVIGDVRERLSEAGLDDWIPPERIPAQSEAEARVSERYSARYGGRSGAPTEVEMTRLPMAQRVLGREVSPQQAVAVETAHLVGSGEIGADSTPARVGNYTNTQLVEKMRILRNAGFNSDEARLLIQRGVVGEEVGVNTSDIEAIRAELAQNLKRQPIHQEIDLAMLQRRLKATGNASLKAQIAQKMQEIEAVNPPMPSSGFAPRGNGGGAAPQASGQAATTVAPQQPQVPVTLPAAAPQTISTFATTGQPAVNQVVNNTTLVQNTSPSGGEQALSVRGGGEVSSGELHPRYQTDQPGSADERWRQQQNTESEMRRALGDALKPIAEAAKRSGGNDVDPNSVADQAARRISSNNGPRQ